MLAPAKIHPQVALLIVYVVTFALFLDNNSVSTLISPYARSLGATVALAGVIAGAYSAINLLGNLGVGYWVDRIGRRLPLVSGLFLVGTVLLLYPFASDPHLLLGLRAAHGLGASLVSPACLAHIGDVSSSARRGRAMAWYGVASGLAGLSGPPLAGLLRDRMGYAAVFIALAVLVLTLALLALLLFIGVSPAADRSPLVKHNLRQVVGNRRLLLAYTSAFCWMFSFGTLLVFLPIYGWDRGFTSAQNGLLFASFALAAALVQMSPLGRLSDRWGRERLILAGLALLALALVGLGLFGQWEVLMTEMFLYGVGLGLLFPAMTALVADETATRTRGTASGIFTAMISLGMVVGSWSAGGLEWLQKAAGLPPFHFAALVALPGMVWAGLVWARGTRQRTT